ncbi:MAG: HDOD domain-containing protein [Acidobacteriota bacterium]
MNTVKDDPAVRIGRNFEMPSVPTVLMRVLQLVDDNTASAKRLEELILHDPSLSVRILKLANSAFYSFRSEVKTISHAIALLGLNLVKSLAIGVSIFESFTKGLRNEAAYITQLWMHSFGVGLITQEVMIRRASRTEAEFAFLCGLLHDLGEVMFFKQDPRNYSRFFAAEKRTEDPDYCALEVEQYGVAHTTLGSMLARHWGLPPDLASVARYHHDPLDVDVPVVRAVALADHLARIARVGHDGDNRVHDVMREIQERLQMDEPEHESITAFAHSKKQEVEDFFSAAS